MTQEKSKLTESDIRNLSKMPNNKWVEAIDMFPAITRADYALKRLVEAGYVEKKLVGLYGKGSLKFKYRKINNIL